MLSRGLQQHRTAASSGGGALPTGDAVDWRREKALARHRQAMETMSFAASSQTDGQQQQQEQQHLTRAQRVQQYQELIDGKPGSKYAHADYRAGGGTQIGGGATQTTSMSVDFDNPCFFKESSTTLAKGAPAIRGSYVRADLDPVTSGCSPLASSCCPWSCPLSRASLTYVYTYLLPPPLDTQTRPHQVLSSGVIARQRLRQLPSSVA